MAPSTGQQLHLLAPRLRQPQPKHHGRPPRPLDPMAQQPLDDANSHWTVVQDKAHQAVTQWRRALREKVSGEVHQKHMKLTSIILMNSQLRLTVDSLGEGEEHMMLFYGFAADELMDMEDVRGVRMGKSVIKWIGEGQDAYPVLRNSRSRVE
ncbi:hypothetical protein FCULG_00006991 [Fusarium culmorum]|uniref:Uncharacterized protein n=1 Tax=Fusarium culmorum TaxID=5516 RepID=A0A2T4GXK5_FUSCU|nr:hypothetical protein FCULG_00006991 [Fusarium culmorum]